MNNDSSTNTTTPTAKHRNATGGGTSALKRLFTPVASLKITVFLIVSTVLLVFAGTTAQKDYGAWDVQRDYFHTWVVMAPLKYFVPLTAWSDTLPGRIPLLGGYTIAIAMLVNVLTANVLRFKVGWRDLLIVPPLLALVWLTGNLTFSAGYYVLTAALIVASVPLLAAVYWLHEKRGGVILIHMGLILILLGELGTSVTAVEQNMRIDEGGSANYGFDIRHPELVVIDRSASDHDNVAAIDHPRLKPGTTLSDPALPFQIQVDAYYPNSRLLGPNEPRPGDLPKATAGAGVTSAAVQVNKAPGVAMGQADIPSSYLTLSQGGQEIGKYLVSGFLNAQPVKVGDKTYDIELRFRRYYKPYSLHLIDFRFDRHTGTNTARNFSSLVRLVDNEKGVDREVKIWMNHPLRYAGETFYQSSFDDATERTTVLQVVRNPSWLFPYIACVVGGLGMFAHFGLMLTRFIERRGVENSGFAVAGGRAATRAFGLGIFGLLWKAWMVSREERRNDDKAGGRSGQYTLAARPTFLGGVVTPGAVLALCLIYLVGVVARPGDNGKDGFDLQAAAAIPMNLDGRVLPLDTLARVNLKVITGGKEDLRKLEGKPPVMQFLLDTFTRKDRAQHYEMFRIDNAEVMALMGLQEVRENPDTKGREERMFFAWNELEPNLEKLRGEAIKASEIPTKEQTVYQRQVGELWKKVRAFDTLAALGGLHVIPPKEKGGEWRALGPAFDAAQRAGAPDPDVMSFTEVLRHYSNGDAPAFERAVTEHRARVAKVAPVEATKAGVEVLFNRYAPFFHLMGFYVLVFVLTICAFLGYPLPLRRSAWWVLILTVVLHTLGLVFRMYLQGRPPVTTLYSSAIFIAWGGVLLAMVVEWFFKNGLGLLVASVAGFMSLFIAHNLAMSDGDTLRELQAVLDTNFWLATHVVMITLGYAATFAAGLFAIVYVIRGVLTTGLSKFDSREMVRMTYGTICFAMLFSFVGTVLGGIWADQSWGRFWGWDPKENGAILIVLWNALILHSRWGGLVRDRGIMVLAIFGNIVTAWSWFGTNELGVGLHSYGFMEGTIFWLFTFFLSQLSLIFVGLLPMSIWRSGAALEGTQAPALPIRAKTASPSSETNPPRPDKGPAISAT